MEVRNLFMIPTLLSNQGVMVTCRIRGPCTEESRSSRVMATKETFSSLSSRFGAVHLNPQQLRLRVSIPTPTAHSTGRIFGFLGSGERFQPTTEANVGKKKESCVCFWNGHQLWFRLWSAAKASWMCCQSANAIPGLK